MTAHAFHRDTPPEPAAWQLEACDRDACGCECALPFLTDPLFAPCADQSPRRDAFGNADDA